jgi:SOS-response transcriptional repressor LexA
MEDYERRQRRIFDAIDAVFSDSEIDPTSQAMTDAIRAIIPHATEREIDEGAGWIT